MPNPLAEACYELALANRIIAHEGVLDGFGHVSMRHPTDPGRYLLARSRSPELIEPADIFEFTLDFEPVAAKGVTLYGERVIHGCIYQARPDVNAVCHHHSPSVLPFCITGIELVPVFHMGAVLGTAAPFWDSRDEFGDTNMLVVKPEEGQSLAKALGAHWIVLMRRHGATLVGNATRTRVSHGLLARQCRNPVALDVARQDRPAEPRRSGAHRSPSTAAASDGTGLGYWTTRLEKSGEMRRNRAAAGKARRPDRGRPARRRGPARRRDQVRSGERLIGWTAISDIRCRR